MITTHFRGHKAEQVDGEWYYCDTGESVTDERPCARCGELPTLEGYDACLGFIPNAHSACCGHGVTEPVILHGLPPSYGLYISIGDKEEERIVTVHSHEDCRSVEVCIQYRGEEKEFTLAEFMELLGFK